MGANEDITYMRRALALAEKGLGRTSPNPQVGAVIVRSGVIVGEGWHQRCGGPHAERLALRQAGTKARGATIYVTLEPCCHQGRTPPCVEALLEAGIKRVVIGMKDPYPLVNGRSVRRLRRAGIVVETGCCAQEVRRLNEIFIKYVTTQMPFVMSKTAQTLDGKIATVTGASKWITSHAARQYARRIRNSFDAIMVGINTVLHDDPQLLPARPSKRLKKVVLDSRLRTPPEARFFQRTRPEDCILVTTEAADAGRIQMFRDRGVEVIVCPLRAGQLDLRALLKKLVAHSVTSVLLEGGARLIGAALKERLVDKMHVYIAPCILGDATALSSVVGFQVKDIQRSLRLRHVRLYQLGEDFLLEGYPYYV